LSRSNAIAWAFAEDYDEAERWLRASPQERLRIWQPRHLRQRAPGRFRGPDYGRHCEHGGHPTPDWRGLLPDHTPTLSPGLWWYDLAGHGTSIWSYIVAAAAQRGWSAQISDANSVEAIARAAERWRAEDALVKLTAELPSTIGTMRI
jgi:hypothetical protein